MSSPTPAPPKDATPTRRGLMGILDQTFAGIKRFNDAVRLALRTSSTLPAGGAELEGMLVYNTTTKRANLHIGTSWTQVVVDASGGDVITLAEHIADQLAHPANNIIYSGSGGTWGDGSFFDPGTDTVENVINWLVVELGGTNGSPGAAKIKTAPSGGLVGTNVQAQLLELDAEKMRIDSLAVSAGTSLIGSSSVAGTYFVLTEGSLLDQLYELLAHINSPRPDLVTPTLVTTPPGWINHLYYSKDNCNYGHLLGLVTNNTNSTVGSITITTLPVGVRPTHSMYMQAVVSDLSTDPIGTVPCLITTSGLVQILGSVSPDTTVSLDFPAYKCA